jgi:hypothetical protein
MKSYSIIIVFNDLIFLIISKESLQENFINFQGCIHFFIYAIFKFHYFPV